MAYSFFIPETVNLRKKSFPALFAFLYKDAPKVVVNSELNLWVKAYGNYLQHKKQLSSYYERLDRELSDASSLLAYQYHNHLLWDICRSELLSFFLPKQNYNQSISERDDFSSAKSMLDEDREAVLLNFSAAMFMIDQWMSRQHLFDKKTIFFVFSGSEIFNKALLAVLKKQQLDSNCFCLEHFYTGKHHYLEQYLRPIANGSALACNFLATDKNSDKKTFYQNDQLLLGSESNKNVQKISSVTRLPSTDKTTIALIGQVVNDFSIIETASGYLNSIWFYKQFLAKAIECDFKVVFKPHPWEMRKQNLKRAMTHEDIVDWLDKNFDNWQDNVQIIDSINVEDLIDQTDFVAGLCSQALIEAAIRGKKPAQFGNAFYGGVGFTYDFESVGDYFKQLQNGLLSQTLEKGERRLLENFMGFCLTDWLIDDSIKGCDQVRAKLSQTAGYEAIKANGIVKLWRNLKLTLDLIKNKRR